MPSSMNYTPQTSSSSRQSAASSRVPGPRASSHANHNIHNHTHNEDESMRASSRQSSLERPTRGHSRDSAYSRSDDTTTRGGSHDRLSSPPQAPSSSRTSHMARGAPKLPSYDRMVCAAVARLKNRKGSSIRDIAKNVKSKYASRASAPGGLLKGSAAKISSAARRLVREGKLVREGNQFRLVRGGSGRRSGRKEADPDDDEDDASPRGRRHRCSHHNTSSYRRRAPSASQSRSRSRSRSRGRRRRRRRHRRRRGRRRRGRKRGSGGGGGSVSAGRRRKKGGMRSQKRRLSYSRKYPHRRKYTRGKRRVKHSYRGRPKPETQSQENEALLSIPPSLHPSVPPLPSQKSYCPPVENSIEIFGACRPLKPSVALVARALHGNFMKSFRI